MSSILKVDQLQDSGGNNLVTSNGSGVITAAGLGKVRQIIQFSDTTQTGTTSTSYADSPLFIDITPSSTSSKILIHANFPQYMNTTGAELHTAIFRDSTNLATNAQAGFTDCYNGAAPMIDMASIIYLDSPSTTSQIRYRIKLRRDGSGTGNLGVNSVMNTMTCTEILP